jgi:hypothetical protein
MRIARVRILASKHKMCCVIIMHDSSMNGVEAVRTVLYHCQVPGCGCEKQEKDRQTYN